MAFDRVWTRDGIQGLGVNAVLKEAGVGKALLYRYFGDFVGLARAWAEGETFLPKPIREQALAQAQSSSGRSRRPQVAAAIGYAQALRARPKIRELLIVELLRSPPVTDALDDLRARFGREMRELAAGAGAIDSEDVYAFSFIATAAMTYLALRAEAVPDYYGLKLDREESWQRIEQMLERLAARLLEPVEAGGDAAASPGKCAVSATASEAETAPVSPRPPRRP